MVSGPETGDMTPEAGLAAFDSAVTSVKLLIWIIKTAQEVIRFKETCHKIGELATTLKGVLENNESTLKLQKTFGDLNKLLEDISKFVVRCTTELNLAQRAWEVMWRKRLPKMLGELQGRTLYLIMETTAETRTVIAGQGAVQNNIVTVVNNTETMTRQLVEKDAENAKSSDIAKVLAVLDEQNSAPAAKPLGVEVNFRKDDGRLKILGRLSDQPPRLSATLDGVRVVCIPSLTSAKHHSSKLPRHIMIYSKISAMTLVQPFYGIAETGDPRFKHWALMQDLSPHQSLEQAIQAKTLPKALPERLKIAYELSKTVAYLHSVQVLIKSMTDANIILRPVQGNGVEPVVTNLEEAREFLEQTTGEAYDVRYEAPEYAATSTHSIYTDIWCLGVLIIQIVTEAAPLGISEPLSKDDPGAAALRNRIKRSDFQKEHADLLAKEGILKSVAQIVRDCHAFKPTLRPSAAFVTEQLFDVLSSGIMEILPSSSNPEDAKAAVSLALEAHSKQASHENNSGDITPQLDPDHWLSLEQAYFDGDPTASMLMGQAIWKGLKPTGTEGSQVVLARGRDADEIQRARAAQQYLEFAVDAGVSGLAKDLQDIHSCLARAYRALVPPVALATLPSKTSDDHPSSNHPIPS